VAKKMQINMRVSPAQKAELKRRLRADNKVTVGMGRRPQTMKEWLLDGKLADTKD
jgi:hypothetical protein